MPRTTRSLISASLVLLASAGRLSSAVAVESDDNRWPKIPAGPAGKTLVEFSEQTGIQVFIVPPTLARNLQTRQVTGNLNPRRALTEMLHDTGLTYHFIRANAVEITTRDASEPPIDIASSEVVVRGQHYSDRSQSLDFTVNTRDIDLSGLNSMADLLKTYSWDTGGGCYGDLINNIREARTNSTLGCGLNIHGIGPGGTAVLINGRRVAFGGTAALFGDISRIPLTAVDTLQVTQNGAYTLYGGDVIAGVANFILRQEFRGFEAKVRWTPAIGERVGERLISQTMGGPGGPAVAWCRSSTTIEILYLRRIASRGRAISRRGVGAITTRPSAFRRMS